MTNKEAVKRLESFKAYLTAGNPIWDVNEVAEVFDMAIEALHKQEPMPVESSIDRTWGIRKRVPVCPMCESFLTVTHFIGDGNGKKISYCDSCGQAVSWEEWKYDD